MRDGISERQQIQAARWVMERRKQRGKSIEEIRPAIRRLLKKIKELIREQKKKQQSLKKIASTPGFRHGRDKALADLAWEARRATSPIPIKPPRPKAPQKGKQPRKILESRWKRDWNWALLPNLQDFELAETESDLYAGISSEAQPAPLLKLDDLTPFENLINDATKPTNGVNVSTPARSLEIVNRLAGLQIRLEWIQQTIPPKSSGGVLHELLNQIRPKMSDSLYEIIQKKQIYDPVQITERLIEKLGVSCREEVADQFIIETALPREKEPYLEFQFEWIKQITQHWNWSELKKELLRAVGYEIFVVPDRDDDPEMDVEAKDMRDMLQAVLNKNGEWVDRFGYKTEQEKPIAEAIKTWHALRKPPPKNPHVEIIFGKDGRI